MKGMRAAFNSDAHIADDTICPADLQHEMPPGASRALHLLDARSPGQVTQQQHDVRPALTSRCRRAANGCLIGGGAPQSLRQALR